MRENRVRVVEGKRKKRYILKKFPKIEVMKKKKHMIKVEIHQSDIQEMKSKIFLGFFLKVVDKT